MRSSSSSYLRFCAGRLARTDHLCEHIGLAENQVLVRSDLDLSSPVLGEDDFVALHHVHGDELSVVVPAARADGEDTAALRLFLRRVRKHDAAEGLLLFIEDLDDQAVTKWLQVHSTFLLTALSHCAGTLGVRVPGHCTGERSPSQTRYNLRIWSGSFRQGGACSRR